MKNLFLSIIVLLFVSCEIVPSDSQIIGNWEPVLYDFQNGEVYDYNLQSAVFVAEGKLIHFEAVILDITTVGNPAGYFQIRGLPGSISNVNEHGVITFFFSTGIDIYEVDGRLTSLGGAPIIQFYIPGTFQALSGLFFDEGDIRISGDYFLQ